MYLTCRRTAPVRTRIWCSDGASIGRICPSGTTAGASRLCSFMVQRASASNISVGPRKRKGQSGATPGITERRCPISFAFDWRSPPQIGADGRSCSWLPRPSPWRRCNDMRTSGADAMIGRAQITAPLNQFMRWWVDELIGCIPAAWREIPNRRSQVLDVIVSPDEMTFGRRKAGNDTELGRVSLVGESASAVRAQLGKMRRQINVRRATIVLKLTPEQALRHRIVLPLAVAE